VVSLRVSVLSRLEASDRLVDGGEDLLDEVTGRCVGAVLE
jgi:hypothetical protein